MSAMTLPVNTETYNQNQTIASIFNLNMLLANLIYMLLQAGIPITPP